MPQEIFEKMVQNGGIWCIILWKFDFIVWNIQGNFLHI